MNNISFKANLIEQMQKKVQSTPATTTVLTPAADKKDSVELSANLNSKKPNKKALLGAILGVIILTLAFFKRNKIGGLFKKLFGNAKKQTNDIKQETIKLEEKSTQVAEKIEFPKPKFTCGSENLEQYAVEKKAYVDSIMPYLYKRDKQLKIQAMEAIEKYGSWEHGDKLGLFLGKRDEEIVVPVVRAIAATGGPRQVLLVNSFIRTSENYSQNTYFEILKAIAKLGDMKKLTTSGRKQVSAALNELKKHENPEIAQKANETLKIIFNK